MSKDTDDKFSPEELQKRFEAALRGARIAGHRSMAEVKAAMPKRRKPIKRKSHK